MSKCQQVKWSHFQSIKASILFGRPYILGVVTEETPQRFRVLIKTGLLDYKPYQYANSDAEGRKIVEEAHEIHEF